VYNTKPFEKIKIHLTELDFFFLHSFFSHKPTATRDKRYTSSSASRVSKRVLLILFILNYYIPTLMYIISHYNYIGTRRLFACIKMYTNVSARGVPIYQSIYLGYVYTVQHMNIIYNNITYTGGPHRFNVCPIKKRTYNRKSFTAVFHTLQRNTCGVGNTRKITDLRYINRIIRFVLFFIFFCPREALHEYTFMYRCIYILAVTETANK